MFVGLVWFVCLFVLFCSVLFCFVLCCLFVCLFVLFCFVLFCLFDCWLLGFLVWLFDLFTLFFWFVFSLPCLFAYILCLVVLCFLLITFVTPINVLGDDRWRSPGAQNMMQPSNIHFHEILSFGFLCALYQGTCPIWWDAYRTYRQGFEGGTILLAGKRRKTSVHMPSLREVRAPYWPSTAWIVGCMPPAIELFLRYRYIIRNIMFV